MGNSLKYESICTTSHPFRQNFSKSYTSVGHIVHERFGPIQLFRQNSSKKTNVFVKQIQLPSKYQLVNIAKKLSKRLTQIHPNLLQIYDFIGSQIDQVCGSQNSIKIFVQYIQGNLKREIKHRLKYKNYGFSQQQLQKILYELTLALAYIHENKQFHGQIKMSDILVGQNNQIKLIDKAISVTSFKIGQQGQSVSIIKGKGILFAPSIMKCLENKKTQINSYDPFKGDVFSIGMVLLECASLQQSQLCYDYQRCVIKRDRIDYLLQKLKAQYSPKFIGIIQSMLVQYDEHRPNAKQVLHWIQQFQKSKPNSFSSINQPILFGGDPQSFNVTFS